MSDGRGCLGLWIASPERETGWVEGVRDARALERFVLHRLVAPPTQAVHREECDQIPARRLLPSETPQLLRVETRADLVVDKAARHCVEKDGGEPQNCTGQRWRVRLLRRTHGSHGSGIRGHLRNCGTRVLVGVSVRLPASRGSMRTSPRDATSVTWSTLFILASAYLISSGS